MYLLLQQPISKYQGPGTVSEDKPRKKNRFTCMQIDGCGSPVYSSGSSATTICFVLQIIQILDISSTQGGEKKINLGWRKAVTAPHLGSGKAYRKPAAWVQFGETADPKKLSTAEPQAQQHHYNPLCLILLLIRPTQKPNQGTTASDARFSSAGLVSYLLSQLNHFTKRWEKCKR